MFRSIIWPNFKFDGMFNKIPSSKNEIDKGYKIQELILKFSKKKIEDVKKQLY